ncbi:hypothetical protein NDU88_011454 [Pleurodeles waltl]|uniref:Uncharacterized protein n=1 Tax=Pleurodeles waltl TaxID=8319 RepID=A0AAV7S174_PLEWA|nr:hypothetical protein NDU88_011454 [Pleurodeles waltl]
MPRQRRPNRGGRVASLQPQADRRDWLAERKKNHRGGPRRPSQCIEPPTLTEETRCDAPESPQHASVTEAPSRGWSRVLRARGRSARSAQHHPAPQVLTLAPQH